MKDLLMTQNRNKIGIKVLKHRGSKAGRDTLYTPAAPLVSPPTSCFIGDGGHALRVS